MLPRRHGERASRAAAPERFWHPLVRRLTPLVVRTARGRYPLDRGLRRRRGCRGFECSVRRFQISGCDSASHSPATRTRCPAMRRCGGRQQVRMPPQALLLEPVALAVPAAAARAHGRVDVASYAVRSSFSMKVAACRGARGAASRALGSARPSACSPAVAGYGRSQGESRHSPPPRALYRNPPRRHSANRNAGGRGASPQRRLLGATNRCNRPRLCENSLMRPRSDSAG